MTTDMLTTVGRAALSNAMQQRAVVLGTCAWCKHESDTADWWNATCCTRLCATEQYKHGEHEEDYL